MSNNKWLPIALLIMFCDIFGLRGGVQCKPIRGGPPYVPLASILPGGKGVNYLSDQTQGFGDDMSHQISLGSQLVSAVGDAIEHHESLTNDKMEDISHIVDSNYRRPDDEEQEEEEQEQEEEEEERMNDFNEEHEEDEEMI